VHTLPGVGPCVGALVSDTVLCPVVSETGPCDSNRRLAFGCTFGLLLDEFCWLGGRGYLVSEVPCWEASRVSHSLCIDVSIARWWLARRASASEWDKTPPRKQNVKVQASSSKVVGRFALSRSTAATCCFRSSFNVWSASSRGCAVVPVRLKGCFPFFLDDTDPPPQANGRSDFSKTQTKKRNRRVFRPKS
jgi:hypothetical protein